MTGHPLVLAIWLLDLTAGAIYLAAGWRLLAILPRWQPEKSDSDQLRRERSLALVVFQGRWVLGLQIVALVALVVGISNSWVAHIPGAMCGTGVLQALGSAGAQALLLRMFTLLLLYCWQVVATIDEQRPDMPLALVHGRLLLLAAPLLLFSTWRFGQAMGTVQSQGPVSCCAALYAQVASTGTGGQTIVAMLAPWTWAAICFGGALPIMLWGVFQWRRPVSAGPLAAGLAGGAILLWIGSAAMEVRSTTGPYLLEVLYHPCPWCLFLGEHGGVGFVLFGLLAFTAAEGAAGLASAVIGRRHRPAAVPALARVGLAGRRLWQLVLLFVILAAAPILLWRLGFGGWIR